jgi:molybdopterin-guanine dinucleotide biosynthesis protein MobB
MPIVAVSGPSGAGKTRLLARLVRLLVARGLRVGVLKHTRHRHPLDPPAKDTAVLRRAGAAGSVLAAPHGVAAVVPPTDSPRALSRLLPPVDLVLAEGFRGAPLPRVEVHRRSVSPRFLCATDRRVLAVVTDEPPPRRVPCFRPGEEAALAALLCARYGLVPWRRPRLRDAVSVSSLPRGGSEQTLAPRGAEMAKTSSRRKAGGTVTRRTGGTVTRSRSEAGRKGGRATLRARGPEFFSEIGRKGGKSRGARSRAARRAASGRARMGGRATSRTGGTRAAGTRKAASRRGGR